MHTLLPKIGKVFAGPIINLIIQDKKLSSTELEMVQVEQGVKNTLPFKIIKQSAFAKSLNYA